MTITKVAEEDKLTIALEGRLDTTTAPELEAFAKDELDGVANLELDFEKLDYISSAGLRILLSTQKKMMNNGDMTIINVNEEVMEVFDITGFSSILKIV